MSTSPSGSFRHVIDDVVARITRGELKPGDKLPSRAEMAHQFDVSVSTIDRAMAILVDRGLVTGHKGKGNFVAGQAPANSARDHEPRP